MSRTFTPPRRGMGVVLAGALALALMALLALGPAPRAGAAFTTGECAGPNIIGEGASFAKEAHRVFNKNFKSFYCVGTPGFGTIDVEYKAEGSGAGRDAVKFRDREPRFGMSDEPPSLDEVEQMNKGTGSNPAGSDSNPNDNGQIHVIPAAVGAVAALVNFPDDCNPDLLPQSARTDNKASAGDDALIRVRFNKDQFEEVWAQDADGPVGLLNWDDVFDELGADADCEVPILRVVRFDESGTSFAFKDYLHSIEPARGWLTAFTGPTTKWPGATLAARSDCSNSVGPGAGAADNSDDHLTSGCAKGNGSLVSKLIAEDGSIGYSDLATARNASPSLAVDPAGGDNDTYWTQIENGDDKFVEPTASEDGFLDVALPEKGSNCQATEFAHVPSSTFGDWSKATGVNSEVGYGICTMTYGLVFDDNADIWGNDTAEEAKARTVKDYWENIVSEGAQGRLFENDYAPLPPSVLAIAKAGVASVGWEKGESGSDDPGGDGNPGGGGGTGGGSTTTPPVATVSNLFSLPRKLISSKTGQATVSVKIPGPGRVEMVGTASLPSGKGERSRKKTVQVGRTVLNASKAGTFNLTLKPSGAAKRQLAKKGRLKVNLKITYTPTGGTAKTTNSTVTLKLAKKRSAKRR